MGVQCVAIAALLGAILVGGVCADTRTFIIPSGTCDGVTESVSSATWYQLSATYTAG